MLWICGILAWLGILHRGTFALFGLKFYLSFALSSLTVNLFLNGRGLLKYLPKTVGLHGTIYSLTVI